MPDNQFRAQRSPSPKASPKALPPLSKFYYGPTQGRGSAEASPASYSASTWTLNSPQEQAPAVPPRIPPSAPPYSPTQWAKNFPSHSDPSQGWDEHIPPPSAPPSAQFIDSYALMHKSSRSPVNPTWDSTSPRASIDASRWSVNYQSIEGQKPVPPAKPPLPPRTIQNQDQVERRPSGNRRPSQNFPQSMYSTKQTPSSRVSATTIDVPLFLQPFAYDPETAPPLPPRPSISPPQDPQSPMGSVQSVPHPQRLPPPPPKIPLDYEGDSQTAPPSVQRPRQDSRFSFEDAQPHTQSPHVAQRRPTYDPQDSHGSETSNTESQQRHSLQPKIPTPRFSSFNAASALPPPLNESDLDIPSLPTPPTEQQLNKDDDRFRAGQRLHQSSISPLNNNDNDRQVTHHSRWGPQAAQVPSPEPQNTTLAPRDGSITATDVSSNRAGLSTPESQQTSNTSYRESVNQADRSTREQQDDETFYWHSGRSSSGAEEEYSQSGSTTATPGQSSAGKSSSIATAASTVRQEPLSLPVRSSSMTPSPNVVPYGASALGFGGPSDWEYFGDYEAEEVDDEDLYTRSRAPAELPAALASMGSNPSPQDDLQSTFVLDPPPEPNRSPTRHITPVFSSPEDTFERPKHATRDYASTRLRMSSVQSPTRLNNSWNQDDRPISYYQRPDLDDVIRAWSEAPYVGVDRSKDPNPQAVGEDDEIEVDKFAEASLASTPQDRFLGIDLILKDAPEMPKLPDSVDQTSPAFPSPSFGQQKFEKIATVESAKMSDSSRPTADSKKRFSKRLEPLIEREIEAVEMQSVGGHVAQRAATPPLPEGSSSDFSLKANPKEAPSRRLSEGKDKEIPIEKPAAEDNSKLPGIEARDFNNLGSPSKHSSVPSSTNVTSETSQTTPEQEFTTSVYQNDLRVSQLEQQEGPETNSMAEDFKSQTQDLHDAGPKQPHKDLPNAQAERPLNIRQSFAEDVPTLSDHSPRINLPATAKQNGAEETFKDAVSTLSSRPSSQEGVRASRGILVGHELPTTIASEGDELASARKEEETQGTANNVTEDMPSKPPTRTPAPIKVAPVDPGERAPQQGPLRSAKSAERAGGPSMPNSPKAPSSPKNIKVIDPYADLDLWGKASLNRFAAMLREEARVESNREKLNIFNVFTSRESRLRVVLYGSDDELILPPKEDETVETVKEPLMQDPASRKADGETFDEQQAKKEAPIMPANAQQTALSSGQDSLTPDEQQASDDKTATRVAAKDGSTNEQKPIMPQSQNKKSFVQEAIERANTVSSLKALPALPPNRDSVVGLPTGRLTIPDAKPSAKSQQQGIAFGVNSGAETDSPLNDMQYSPGGRPIIPTLPRELPESLKGVESNAENRASKMIDGNSLEPEQATVPEARPRPRQKTKEGVSEVNNYLTNRRSVYRPFASQTLETMESSSNFGRQSDINIDSTPMPLLRAPSSKFSATPKTTKEAENLPEVVPETVPQVPTNPEQSDMRQFIHADFDPLLMVLPEGEARAADSNRLQDLKDIMEAIPEDFSFIHASVVAWDANTRVQRETNDRLRHERQAESEKHIDSLFDDHEIGYGDISELEAEFKRSEAARKADEDRSEYQTFVSDVFDLVWTRLHYELDQLLPHYERYGEIMDETLAGKDMFDRADKGLALAPTMTEFLALHQKIEIRHQKAFEAVLERDRRLKKTEISPWYTLNNIPKVKQLEKQFEDAERRAIIEYCEQRDGRANQLMDVLDQNTLRGVGANQDYMEAIMKAVRRIASGQAFASVPGTEGAAAGGEAVQKAQTLTALLATSSEQIVQTFHVADMLLNSADYEVSVAKAKVARVDMATLVKLKEERAKEDQKLMRDLEHRLALIREDSRRTNDEIIKLMLFLGVNQERGHDAAPRGLGKHMRGGSLEAGAILDMQAGPVNDPEHQERMRKALEEAKKRNAVKASGT